MAKKAPKEFKPGQHVIVKLSNGRIEEARVNHVEIKKHSGRPKGKPTKLAVPVARQFRGLPGVVRC